MGDIFCSDFLANFFADLLAGLILGVLFGGLLALWVGKKLNELARTEERRKEKRAELQKAIRYLELLKGEIDELLDLLPELIRQFEETGWGREIRIPTPRWDILHPSGELPRLIDPGVLESLTLFYDHIRYAKRGRDLTIDSWLVPHPDTVPGMKLKLDAFVRMTLVGLKRARDAGLGLPDKLHSEIQVLREQLDTL